jgi:hypothetical protein
MKINKLKRKLICIALLPIALAIREYLSYNNKLTESIYSRVIYPPIGKSLSRLTGIFNFSLAEVLLCAAILIVFYLIVRAVFNLIRSSNKLQEAVNTALNALCIVSIAYCLFLFLWGFNYYRQPLAYSLGYNIEKSTVDDLKSLCADLIDKTNSKRAEVPENLSGIMYIKGGLGDVMSRASKGYEKLALSYPVFSGSYGKPKGVSASRALSYTGIAGIYFPYTGEANVTSLCRSPCCLLPFATRWHTKGALPEKMRQTL